jgi:hypothetical protein
VISSSAGKKYGVPSQIYRGQEDENELIDLLVWSGGDRARGRMKSGGRLGRRIRRNGLFAGREQPVVVEFLLDLPDNRPFQPKMDVSDRRFRSPRKQVLGANIQAADEGAAPIDDETLLMQSQIKKRHLPGQDRM